MAEDTKRLTNEEIQKRYLQRVNAFFTQVKQWLPNNFVTSEDPHMIADSTGEYPANIGHPSYSYKSSEQFAEKKTITQDKTPEVNIHLSSVKNKSQISKKLKYWLEQEHRTKLQSNACLT